MVTLINIGAYVAPVTQNQNERLISHRHRAERRDAEITRRQKPFPLFPTTR